MLIFNILITIFFVLIILVISSTIIKLALFLTNKYKYENYILILPSILSIISWLIAFTLLFITLSIMFKENFFNFIIDKILNHISITPYLPSILILTISFCIIGIILQTFSFLTVNIDYTKTNGKLRVSIKNLFKVQLNKKNSTQLKVSENTEKLSLKAALLSSILTFSLIVFFSLLLFSIGKMISNKLI